MTVITERLKSARNSAGLTFARLSEVTGGQLSSSRIANYESGLRGLKVEQAKILAEALSVTPQFLLGIEDKTDGSEKFTDVQKQFQMLTNKMLRREENEIQQACAVLRALLHTAPKD